MMKLAIVCVCLLHLVLVSGRIFTRKELQVRRSNLTLERTGAVNPGRQRTLFARRGQYERQRIHVPKPKVVPGPQNNRPPTKAPPKPAAPACSQLTQSCVPKSGCCDLCATCHCHFFNAICYCRRTNSQCKKKT